MVFRYIRADMKLHALALLREGWEMDKINMATECEGASSAKIGLATTLLSNQILLPLGNGEFQ
jgi:hypothetical protein